MKDQRAPSYPVVNRIGDAVMKKILANQEIVNKSSSYGRITWRVNKKNGEIEVDLEPKL